MHRTAAFVWGIVFLVAVASSAAAAEKDLEAAEELWKKLPELPDPKVKTLRASGVYRGVGWELLYKAPDRHALHLRGKSGIPVLAAVGGEALVYEPYSGAVHWAKAAVSYVEIRSERGGFLFNYWVLDSKDRKPAARIDIPSLRKVAVRAVTASKRPEGLLFRARGHRGHRVEALFDPSRPNPLKRLTLYTDRPQPYFQIDKLHVNEPIPDTAFRMPDVAASKERLGATPIDLGTEQGYEESRTSIWWAFGVRMGLDDKSTRADVEGWFPVSLNWDRLAEGDRKKGPLLKRFLGPTLPTKAAKTTAKPKADTPEKKE